MKLALKFHSRERRLALMAGSLIGCWILVSWVVQPLWDRLRDLRLRVTTHEEKLSSLYHLLANASTIEGRYRAYAPYLQSGADERSHAAFLGELETLARQADVQLNLKPRPPKSAGDMSRFEIELDAEGAQADLLTFVDRLLQLPQLVSIERLRIAVVPAKPDVLKASLLLHKLIPQR